MGLVLTLFKASVWSLIQTHQDEMEEEEEQRRHHQEDDNTHQYNSAYSEEQGRTAGDETITIRQEY